MARLIAIEGIDGSGKGTQARQLVQTLVARGHRVGSSGFPRYSETFFGARVGDFLNGRFGGMAQVDPFLAALLFAGDRFESRQLLQRLLAEQEFVVLDRYVASNIAHQAAKRDGAARSELQVWIRRLEFDVYELPPPDVTILLDLPAELARQLVARKAARDYTDAAADLQEADLDYQRRVRDLYLSLAAREQGWTVVPVTGPDGALRSIESVAADVLAAALSAG